MENEVRAEIGRVVRELREKAGLTLQGLEEKTAELGVRLPRSTINDIEAGRSSIPAEALAVLGSVLGVGTLDLLSRVVERIGASRVAAGSPEELAARGQELAERGADLEAAWHYDAAARATADEVTAAKMLTNASRAYFMAGAYELSLQRIEMVLDREGLPGDVRLAALARSAYLLAALGRNGRARDQLLLVRRYREESGEIAPLPYSEVTESWTLLVLGEDADRIRATGRRGAEGYREFGRNADVARALAGVALASLLDGGDPDAAKVADEALKLASRGKDQGAIVLASVTVAAFALRADPGRVPALLRFATVPRPALAHRAECLAAWMLLEQLAGASGDHRTAARWRRKADRVHDPVCRRLAGCYTRGLLAAEGREEER